MAVAFSSGLFELGQLNEPDLSAISAILVTYRSLGIQLADAAIVHLANRHGINKIFTLDRRDFGVLRGTSGKPFQLLP